MLPDFTPRLSFIIPALNEEVNISDTLASIKAFADEFCHEVIVCDHGSVDRTRELAIAAGARVLQPPAETIGGLRNAGAALASGQLFIFVDADVALTPEWKTASFSALAPLLSDPMIITGSHCEADGLRDGWYGYWFRGLSSRSRTGYIATTHLIVSRDLFEKVGGFDSSLKTGEDYDFCQRCLAVGARIQPDPLLRAIHKRLPRNLKHFIMRERWHGLSDSRSIRAVLKSKVALASLVFLALHIALLLSILLYRPMAWFLVAGIFLLLLASERARFGARRLGDIVKGGALFYFYYMGRVLSFLPASRGRWTGV